MTRIAGACVLFAALTASAACGVGGGDSTPPGGDDQPPPPIDNGEVCQASFAITGTFTAGTPGRPIDPDTNLPITGCWPVGTWTFTATVAANNCATAPSLLSSYSFRVDRMPPSDGGNDLVQSITSLTSAGTMQSHLTMSSNGQGCEGSFELGSADGKQYWNLQPTLPKDPAATTVSGGGDYIEYKTDGWPWKS